MRCYSEAVKADVRRFIRPPHRQSVAQILAVRSFTWPLSTTEGCPGGAITPHRLKCSR